MYVILIYKLYDTKMPYNYVSYYKECSYEQGIAICLQGKFCTFLVFKCLILYYIMRS